MSTISDILHSINELSLGDKQKLQSILMSSAFVKSLNMQEFLTNERFANGRACPLCGSVSVVRNGHRADGTQRFVCRDCHKSFVVTTNSIVAGTKKDLSVWEQYISCMMQGMSIRKTAEVCGIHRNTAFYWRHKILDALQNMADNVTLNGIVEADETFFAVSYKGNHKKSKTFVMPREAHKRGGETHTRGLSREQVCVPCAVNRNGLSISKAANLGRITTDSLLDMFDGRIDENSTIVTDKASAYVRFADKTNLKLVQLKGGKAKSGIYHIQHINSYHGMLKKFMRGFNGVSTKYLNNYLIWHSFVNYAKETSIEKQRILLNYVFSVTMNETCRQLTNRQILPDVA
ncbi:MAG: IS1595 family transposase [Clostridia bacterium]|nr:IS1595 family transposase [Clostridia bacterium]